MVFGDKNGFVKAADVMSAIKPNTKLVVMTHVSNVCGSIQPVYELGKMLSGTGVAFLVDCAQSAGVLEVDAKKMKADMIAVSGHKGIMSPLGVGGLYVSEKIDLKPVMTGGTGTASESLKQPDFMPDKLTAGTQNTPAIAAFGEACSFILKEGRENIFRHETELANEFISELENMKGVEIYGSKANRNSTVAFNIGDKHSQEVTEILDRDFGIACRGGWHCAFFAHKTLGTEKTGAVRCGFGYFSTREELKKLIDAVYKISIL